MKMCRVARRQGFISQSDDLEVSPSTYWEQGELVHKVVNRYGHLYYDCCIMRHIAFCTVLACWTTDCCINCV